MGLKNLKKGARIDTENRAAAMINPIILEEKAASFITAAKDRQSFTSLDRKQEDKRGGRTKKPVRYLRCIFSLTPDISEEIDRLSCLPTRFRAGRSDVIKAALTAFNHLPDDIIIQHLQSVIKDDT